MLWTQLSSVDVVLVITSIIKLMLIELTYCCLVRWHVDVMTGLNRHTRRAVCDQKPKKPDCPTNDFTFVLISHNRTLVETACNEV